MRMEQLRCLVDIAQTGSLTKTAQRLFLSQQAVSKSMKQLEQELGIAILFRTNLGVQITPEGQSVLEFAQNVLAEKEKLTLTIHGEQAKKKEVKLLKVCSTSAITNIVLPNVIQQLESHQEKIKLKISMLDTLSDMLNKVQDRCYDLGLVTFNADELLRQVSAFEEELYLDILARDEIIALMHKRFLKDEEGNITTQEFVQHPLTLYNLIPANDSIDEDYPRELQESYLLYSNDADFHRAMLEKNGAIVLMPSLAQQYFFSSKQLVPVNLPLDTPLLHAAIYRKDAEHDVQDIVMMMRREMQMK